MPRIVSIGPSRPKTLLDYREPTFGKGAAGFVNDTRLIFTDHEVKLLLLWAVVAPSAGLAYLVWIKYPRLRVFAVLLLIISVFQFLGQWGGVFWLAQRFFGQG